MKFCGLQQLHNFTTWIHGNLKINFSNKAIYELRYMVESFNFINTQSLARTLLALVYYSLAIDTRVYQIHNSKCIANTYLTSTSYC